MNAQAPASIASDSTANLEAEQALLGAILCRNEAFGAITCEIEPSDFAEPIHARVFEAAAAMIKDGRRASPVTLKSYFEGDQTLKEIGGTVYLARLAAAATTIINVPEYARIIRDLSARRQAIMRCQDAVMELQILPVDTGAEQYCSALAHDISQISEGVGAKVRSSFSAAAVMTAAIDDAASAYQNEGRRIDAMPTGIEALDGKIGGLVKTDLVIIGGRPSMGKTALALQLLVNTARATCAGLFVSLEMSKAQIGHRLLAIRTGINYRRIAWGKFSEREFGQIVDAGKIVEAMPFTVEDRSSMTLAQLAAVVGRAKTKNSNLGIVFLDYLGLVLPSDRYRGHTVDELAEISAGCKRLAKQYDVCFVALQQLNRALESRDNKRPTLADIRSSGAIEQDADVVMFPYREAYYVARELENATEGSTEQLDLTDRLSKVDRTMEIIVAKNRQGAIGAVKVYCDIARNIIHDADTQRSLAGEPF